MTVVVPVTRVPREGATLPKRENRGHDTIQKIAVVRDNEDTSGPAFDQLSEGSERRDVEIIGGLVEEQDVGSCLERERPCDASALAA